jgi:hypothetical protein
MMRALLAVGRAGFWKYVVGDVVALDAQAPLDDLRATGPRMRCSKSRHVGERTSAHIEQTALRRRSHFDMDRGPERSARLGDVSQLRMTSIAQRDPYSPMVRTTLFSGRLLLDESLSCCLTISSYFGNVSSSFFGTICTTL